MTAAGGSRRTANPWTRGPSSVRTGPRALSPARRASCGGSRRSSPTNIECAVAALGNEDPNAMLAYDRILRASPFLDPLLSWMIDRVRTWSDALMDSVTEELQGLDWRAVDARLSLRVAVRKPWLALHARD